MAVAFLLAAAATIALLGLDRDIDVLLLVALVAGYAAISRVEFEIGAGLAVPEALLFVPMLFLVPTALVPILVVVAFVALRIPELITRDEHVGRALYGVSDAWFTIGPVLVIGLLAPDEPMVEAIDVYALAFAAQGVTGIGAAMVVERLALGTRFSETFRSALWSYRVDGVLWPIGLLVAAGAMKSPVVLVAVAPLVWMLAVFSRERKHRYAAALELNRAYRGTVMLLSDVVEADDNYTADHCRSVVELVTTVADELEIPDTERQELEFAALLHDVGKIAIPKDILNKPSKLTTDEFEVMKTHTIEGQQMLDRVGGLLGRVGMIVRSCHERWDGGGYPDGLTGEQIPLAARIVFSCDAYNAMTTNRPYRAAMSPEDALYELRENAGTQFDPWVVAGLIRVVERGPVESRPTPAESIAALFAQQPGALKTEN